MQTNPPMRDGTLTHAWVQAETSLPHDWTLMGVVLGLREHDPVIHEAAWMAWARGPGHGHAEATGHTPEEALSNLSIRLAEIRGSLSG